MTSHYEFDIQRATCAADLHVLSEDIMVEDTLAGSEQEALLAQIAAKASRLNAAAAAKSSLQRDPGQP